MPVDRPEMHMARSSVVRDRTVDRDGMDMLSACHRRNGARDVTIPAARVEGTRDASVRVAARSICVAGRRTAGIAYPDLTLRNAGEGALACRFLPCPGHGRPSGIAIHRQTLRRRGAPGAGVTNTTRAGVASLEGRTGLRGAVQTRRTDRVNLVRNCRPLRHPAEPSVGSGPDTSGRRPQ